MVQPTVTDSPPTELSNNPQHQGCSRLPTEGIMHPMFKELFIDTDAEDLVAEENWRRRVRRSQRARSAMVVRPVARNRQRRSRP